MRMSRRCFNCGSEKTKRGRYLAGKYCSPTCQAEHRRKPLSIIGVDFGTRDTFVEVTSQRMEDGSIKPIRYRDLSR